MQSVPPSSRPATGFDLGKTLPSNASGSDTQPWVSVIIPAYNGSRTIESAVNSVLSQNYSFFELLVVDDASTDDTVQRLRQYGERIRLIQRPTNSGICELARQEAIRLARGKYLAFLDQDDLWEPDKLRRQVEFMERHPEFPISHHYVWVIDENNRPQEVRHEGRIPPSGPCARELMRHCFVTASSIMVLPHAWQIGIEAHGNLHSNADIEQFMAIQRRFPAGFGFIPEVLGSYRRWTESMSRQDWRWGPEDVNALERVYRDGFWKGLLTRRDARCLVRAAYRANAEHHRHAGHPERSLYFALHGLRHGLLDFDLWSALAKSLARFVIHGGHR